MFAKFEKAGGRPRAALAWRYAVVRFLKRRGAANARRMDVRGRACWMYIQRRMLQVRFDGDVFATFERRGSDHVYATASGPMARESLMASVCVLE